MTCPASPINVSKVFEELRASAPKPHPPVVETPASQKHLHEAGSHPKHEDHSRHQRQQKRYPDPRAYSVGDDEENSRRATNQKRPSGREQIPQLAAVHRTEPDSHLDRTGIAVTREMIRDTLDSITDQECCHT